MKDVMIRARELIEKPENWIQGAYSRDKDGNFVFPYSLDACQFCLVGALRRASSEKGFDGNFYVLINDNPPFLKKVNMHVGITIFNDNTEHADVLEYLDKLIEKAAI